MQTKARAISGWPAWFGAIFGVLVGCALSPEQMDPLDSDGHSATDVDAALAGRDAATNERDKRDAKPSMLAQPGDSDDRADDQTDDDQTEDQGAEEDAGQRDAAPIEPSGPPATDASTPKADASLAISRDAGRDARADDASARRDASLPAGSCRSAFDCREPCVLTGILPCCRDDHVCGCTWAPGAYCL